MSQSGKVKWFNKAKGYGFIVPEDGGKDLFFHFKQLAQGLSQFESLDGRLVTFEVGQERGRKCAKNVCARASDDTPSPVDSSVLPVGTIFAGIIPETIFDGKLSCFVPVESVKDGDRWDGEVEFKAVHLHLSQLTEELALHVQPTQLFTLEVIEGQKGRTTARVLGLNTELSVTLSFEPV